MPLPIINLSVTGEDTPYSILMAEHALKLNPKVDYLIIPMTYYQGCYDISDDDISLHKDVVSRINIPILKNARNYKGTIISPDGYNIGNPLKIYDMALDLNEARSQRDDAIRDSLAHMEYFNDMNPHNPSGSLKFTFQELTEDEKYASAKITAEHNERVCTKKGYLEVKKYLKPFLDEMRENGKKLLFFVPPMTEYLYESYHKQLKDFYYSKIVIMLEHYDNVKFIDLAVESKTFLETDFCDFEHLNIQGAKKLTKIIGHTLKQF